MTLAFLEGYLKHYDAYTSRLLRSYAEAAELYAAKPIILEDEVLVGQLYLPEYTEEEQKRYDELCDMFIMSSSTLEMFGLRNTHLSLDFEKAPDLTPKMHFGDTAYLRPPAILIYLWY